MGIHQFIFNTVIRKSIEGNWRKTFGAMTKKNNPSFKFYPELWDGGTIGMDLKEKGAYLSLLLLQFYNNGFTIEHAAEHIGEEFGNVWIVLKRKFELKDGLYFNLKLQKEMDKGKKTPIIKTHQLSDIIYQQCKDFYWDWHIEKVGFKPQMDGSDFKALKLIIGFFYSLDDSYDNILRNFKAVLSKYDSWDKFDKTQTRLRQINSRLTNIINHLKNGKGTSTSQGLANALERRIREKRSNAAL